MERCLQVYLLEPGPRLMKKRIYRAAVSQRLRNNGLEEMFRVTFAPPCIVYQNINSVLPDTFDLSSNKLAYIS